MKNETGVRVLRWAVALLLVVQCVQFVGRLEPAHAAPPSAPTATTKPSISPTATGKSSNPSPTAPGNSNPPTPPAVLPGIADPCDQDRDGHRSLACGGDDCDDGDPFRYPGNLERCDGTLGNGRSAANHDEDCNPCTVSGPEPDGDGDRDGVPSSRCVNVYGELSALVGCNGRKVRLHTGRRHVLGADCDDAKRAIVPGAQACVPSDPGAVRVCGERLADVSVIDWEIQRCPSGPTGAPGRCVPQPNGTGVCVN